ncbi:MAG: endonuclease III [Deltaproteobacteria bacterium]|nr:endonuclease III [Deltaproteobacteria bacterium]
MARPSRTSPSHEKIEQIIRELKRLYPDAECSLDFKSPYQLLVATILSAQCTDARVNLTTPALFSKFPDAKKMSEAKVTEIEQLIKSTGFYRAKAKNILAASQKLVEKFSGKVPGTMEELYDLPGVGRKTANVVLGNAFDKPAGVVVDTHVKRLCFRLGLTRQTDPTKIETELNVLIPEKYWTDFSHWLIQHGRRICIARNPQCEVCSLAKLCPKIGVQK